MCVPCYVVPCLTAAAAVHVCVCCRRAASQLGDNYSPIKGPGLAPGSTVSSYLENVSIGTFCPAPRAPPIVSGACCAAQQWWWFLCLQCHLPEQLIAPLHVCVSAHRPSALLSMLLLLCRCMGTSMASGGGPC
jgi:hypothetical protein